MPKIRCDHCGQTECIVVPHRKLREFTASAATVNAIHPSVLVVIIKGLTSLAIEGFRYFTRQHLYCQGCGRLSDL